MNAPTAQALRGERGQSSAETAIIIVLVAVIAIGALAVLGWVIRNRLGGASSVMDANAPASTGAANTSVAETSQPQRSTAEILQDFRSRLQAFYDRNGRWPRSWSPYNFTDLGLNPDDWSQPVNGLYFSPRGSDVKIANKVGDNLQVYVVDAKGKTRQVYDGWSIFCTVSNPKCYYHTIAPGNEVDISTIYVVEQ